MRWYKIKKNDNYEINKRGDVRNASTKRILTGSVNNSGYRTVHIRHNDNPEFVHRLVAETFIPNRNPKCNTDVNHKDGNKLNNSVDNLEWVSRSYNVRHAYANGLNRPSGGGHNKRAIKVVETGMVYDSQEACAEAINGSAAGVSFVINGKRKTNRYKGYHLESV